MRKTSCKLLPVAGFVNGRFDVDAGVIAVADLDYVKSKGGSFGKGLKKISLEKGWYAVDVRIHNSWRGDLVTETCELHIPSGTAIIGDICYAFSDTHDLPDKDPWDDLLQETDYLKKPQDSMFVVDTGGDGTFRTAVSFVQIPRRTTTHAGRSTAKRKRSKK